MRHAIATDKPEMGGYVRNGLEYAVTFAHPHDAQDCARAQAGRFPGFSFHVVDAPSHWDPTDEEIAAIAAGQERA